MRTLKKTATVVAALVVAVGSLSAPVAWANARQTDPAGKSSLPGHSRLHHALAGTWTTTVQLTDAPPGVPTEFNALDTFLPGGGLLVSSSAPNPETRSLAHGNWVHTHHRQFTSTFVWFRFDPAGNYIGTQRVQRTMTLEKGLKTFRATDLIEVMAPNGVVVATIHGTEVGQRLPN